MFLAILWEEDTRKLRNLRPLLRLTRLVVEGLDVAWRDGCQLSERHVREPFHFLELRRSLALNADEACRALDLEADDARDEAGTPPQEGFVEPGPCIDSGEDLLEAPEMQLSVKRSDLGLSEVSWRCDSHEIAFIQNAKGPAVIAPPDRRLPGRQEIVKLVWKR